jgi:predicted DNA-binding transcriptional regulator AlpA
MLTNSQESRYDINGTYNYYLDKLNQQFSGKLMLSKKEVGAAIGMSESTLYRNMNRRVDLPPYKKYGATHYAFPLTGVAKWLALQSS